MEGFLFSSAASSQNRIDPIIQSVKCDRSELGIVRSRENGHVSTITFGPTVTFGPQHGYAIQV